MTCPGCGTQEMNIRQLQIDNFHLAETPRPVHSSEGSVNPKMKRLNPFVVSLCANRAETCYLLVAVIEEAALDKEGRFDFFFFPAMIRGQSHVRVWRGVNVLVVLLRSAMYY